MKKLLILCISILIFNCSSDDSNNDNPPEDTVICEKAISVDIFNTSENSASITWISEDTGETTPNSWIIEIGSQGFTPGSGTTSNTSSNFFYDFNNLTPSTTYDVYIKSNCGNNVFGDNVGPYSFTTESSCSTPSGLNFYTLGSCGFGIDWFGQGESAWEIEYGESGFTLGTGTVINTSNIDYYIEEGISPNTTYEVYVRANCGSQGYSNYTDALVVTTEQNTGVSSNFLTGNYLLETLSDGAFTGNGLGDIFGAPVTVNIQSGPNNVRDFFYTYYPDSFTNTLQFEFQLSNNGLVQVGLNDTLSYSCDNGATTSIVLGPSNQNQPYNVCDDSVIEFTFFELYQGTGSCGASDFPVTIRLTKQ